MTPIPEILKGEVREFIWFTENVPYQTYGDDLFSLRDFYLQTFQPEMIMGYFDNITQNKDWLYSNENDKNIIISAIKGKVSIDGCILNRPESLSQFITNCIQVGIKLTWRNK